MENAYDTLSAKEQEVHKRLDSWVDFTKPLLPQVKKMTNEEFIAFVRRPRHMDDTDGVILFENPAEDAS